MSLYFHEKTADGFSARLVSKVLCHEKTSYQEVTIVEHPNLGRTLYLNGCFQADDNFQVEYHVQMVSLVPEQTREQSGLVIVCGSGPGGLVETCLREFKDTHILALELDEKAYRLYTKYLPDWGWGNSNRVSFEIADVFEYLKHIKNSPINTLFWDIDTDALPGSVIWEDTWALVSRILAPGGTLVATAGFIAERASQDPYTVFLDSLKKAFPSGKVTDYTRLNWKFFSYTKH